MAEERDANGRALIVVDMSVEQVGNLYYRKDEVIKNIQTLTEADNLSWASKMDARLWLHSITESTLSRVYPEWGDTMGVPDSEGASLIPQLRDRGLTFVEKKHYSSFVDSELLTLLENAGVGKVYVTGINTNYCVFATALDAQARGRFDTFVVEDAVSSVDGRAGHEEGIRWIVGHLGEEALVTTKRVLDLRNEHG